MSGNPSGPQSHRPSGGGTGGGGDGDEVDCDLAFRTPLASPVGPVIGALSPGDVLFLELREEDGVRVVAAVTPRGDVAGTIVAQIRALIRCIQQGNRYEATVVSVTGGSCVVAVVRVS